MIMEELQETLVYSVKCDNMSLSGSGGSRKSDGGGERGTASTDSRRREAAASETSRKETPRIPSKGNKALREAGIISYRFTASVDQTNV